MKNFNYSRLICPPLDIRQSVIGFFSCKVDLELLMQMEALISNSSKSYYACVGESTHAFQSPSKDLTAINDHLNGYVYFCCSSLH